jgi:hypothetical protein
MRTEEDSPESLTGWHAVRAIGDGDVVLGGFASEMATTFAAVHGETGRCCGQPTTTRHVGRRHCGDRNSKRDPKVKLFVAAVPSYSHAECAG